MLDVDRIAALVFVCAGPALAFVILSLSFLYDSRAQTKWRVAALVSLPVVAPCIGGFATHFIAPLLPVQGSGVSIALIVFVSTLITAPTLGLMTGDMRVATANVVAGSIASIMIYAVFLLTNDSSGATILAMGGGGVVWMVITMRALAVWAAASARAHAHLCPNCNYDLRSIPIGHCPECNYTLKSWHRRHLQALAEEDGAE